MKMNKNTIDHLATFITEDPNEFSPDLQVSGGPLDIMEQEVRAGILNEFLGGSDDDEEYTVELLTTGTGNWWVLFKGKKDLDAFATETLAVDAATALGAEQVTVKPNARPGLPPPTDRRPNALHNRATGGGAPGTNFNQSGRSFGRQT